MKQLIHTLLIPATGHALHDITEPISAWIGQHGIGTGLLTVWCRYLSASLLATRTRTPEVEADLPNFFRRFPPRPPLPARHRRTG
jgi:thiamine phosphate synthase YjbQ (UPF0047 family)